MTMSSSMEWIQRLHHLHKKEIICLPISFSFPCGLKCEPGTGESTLTSYTHIQHYQGQRSKEAMFLAIHMEQSFLPHLDFLPTFGL